MHKERSHTKAMNRDYFLALLLLHYELILSCLLSVCLSFTNRIERGGRDVYALVAAHTGVCLLVDSIVLFLPATNLKKLMYEKCLVDRVKFGPFIFIL